MDIPGDCGSDRLQLTELFLGGTEARAMGRPLV